MQQQQASVVLIGDSIRMGYQPFVTALLADVADVWGPAQNGGTSSNVRAHLAEWLNGRRPEVVHVNAGLHDIRSAFVAGETPVPLDAYRANVEAILSMLAERTEATVIWALTTPVNEDWHHATHEEWTRYEADVAAVNATARQVCEARGVRVNDLHEVITGAGRDGLLRPDGVHFVEEGSRLLGEAVAGAVRAALGPTARLP